MEEFFEKNKHMIYLVVGIIIFICIFICCLYSVVFGLAYANRPGETSREIINVNIFEDE